MKNFTRTLVPDTLTKLLLRLNTGWHQTAKVGFRYLFLCLVALDIIASLPTIGLQIRLLLLFLMLLSVGMYVAYQYIRNLNARLLKLEQLLAEQTGTPAEAWKVSAGRPEKTTGLRQGLPTISMLNSLKRVIYSPRDSSRLASHGRLWGSRLNTELVFAGTSVNWFQITSNLRHKFQHLRAGMKGYLLPAFMKMQRLVHPHKLIEKYRRRSLLPPENQVSDVTAMHHFEASAPEPSPENQVWLQQLETIVRVNLKCETLNVQWIATQVFLSERQLYRRLKVLTGLTVNEYIREMRLQEARHLLENRLVDTVKKAARTVCFKDLKYFTQIFKARFGKNPSDVLSAYEPANQAYNSCPPF